MSDQSISHNFNDQFSLSTKTMTDEGFVQADAIMSKVGIALYKAGEFSDFQRYGAKTVNDTIRVYRPAHTLFDTKTLQSFANKPVTIGHPKDRSVTVKNARGISVGSIGDHVTQSGDLMKARITITDESAIKLINDGTKFLSVGYKGDIIPESGITDSGESYDAKLISMHGNHVALTDTPRAGVQCSILDEQSTTRLTMSKVQINGINVDINDESVQAVNTVIDSNKELKASITQLEATLKTITDEKITLTAKLDELNEKINDQETINKKVNERIALVDSVRPFLPKFDFSNQSARDIKIAVIKSFNDSFDSAEKSDDYINARMDAAIEYGEKESKSGKTLTKLLNDSAADHIAADQKVMYDPEAAKQAAISKLNNKGAV